MYTLFEEYWELTTSAARYEQSTKMIETPLGVVIPYIRQISTF